MRHPALDSFDDLDAAAADPHVAGCPSCQDELTGQRQVRALLAALPDPGPIPAAVVDRIEATLRSLAQQADPTTDSTPDSTPAPATGRRPALAPSGASTVVPQPSVQPRRPLGHRAPWLAVAAVVLAFAGGGYGLTQVLPGSSGDATQAGAALPERSRPSDQAGSATGGPAAISSGTDYRKATLARQVQDALGQRRVSAAAPSGAFASTDGVAACLEALGASASAPLLVDVATYEGVPAAIVVLPGPAGGREVWVVSTSCRPGQDGLKYFTTVR